MSEWGPAAWRLLPPASLPDLRRQKCSNRGCQDRAEYGITNYGARPPNRRHFCRNHLLIWADHRGPPVSGGEGMPTGSRPRKPFTTRQKGRTT